LKKIPLDRWVKISSIIASVVTVFAIISGGTFALVEYLENKEEKKQAISLDYVSEYHSNEMRQHRERLNSAWEKGYPTLVSALSQEADKSKAFDQFVENLVHDENL
jgi:hypothetical protein